MRWRVIIAALAALATTLFAAASARPESAEGKTLVLSGVGQIRLAVESRPLGGFFPGVTRQLKMVVVNRSGVTVKLRILNARLMSSSRRGCPATSASLRIGTYTGALPVTIRPHTSLRLTGTIAVTMPRNATPKCSNTRFVIALAGVGSKVAR